MQRTMRWTDPGWKKAHVNCGTYLADFDADMRITKALPSEFATARRIISNQTWKKWGGISEKRNPHGRIGGFRETTQMNVLNRSKGIKNGVWKVYNLSQIVTHVGVDWSYSYLSKTTWYSSPENILSWLSWYSSTPFCHNTTLWLLGLLEVKQVRLERIDLPLPHAEFLVGRATWIWILGWRLVGIDWS